MSVFPYLPLPESLSGSAAGRGTQIAFFFMLAGSFAFYWLGGLFGLFFSIDEFHADNDFGDQFRTVEPTPMFLGFQSQFKDHSQCRDS